MKKSAKAIIILVIIILLVLLVGVVGCFFIYNRKYTLNFKKVAEIDKGQNDDGLYWFTLRSEEYHGFYSIEMLENLSSDINDVNGIDFDYNNYTYVITVGHELKELSYSYNNTKNRKYLVIPKQFIGNVTLTTKETDKIYIYRIKRMDIDCDYHSREVGVSFAD